MPVAIICGHAVELDKDGFLTDYEEWNEILAKQLAANIGIDLTDRHWELIRWLRADYRRLGVSSTTRHTQSAGGFSIKEQLELFPKTPAKKMAYVAGLPKPQGCV
ncbi:MAG: TusE/DsrC/DsvC family sulfur relay protein [Candidatus Nanopelagicales bacterium]|nr:TusE/DsrC/DsvC family sulfur relay protein [Candidatus Nanopelagicales bacterium]